MLLVYSLRKFLPDASINILVPKQQLESIRPKGWFEQQGCTIYPFHNDLVVGLDRNLSGNKVSNKLYFLRYPKPEYSRMIFLDSDMLLLQPLNQNELIAPQPFSAKQADRANVTQWERIYSSFNLQMPTARIPCSVDGIKIPPYFNAGFISVNPILANCLFEKWKDYFIALSDPGLLTKCLYKSFNRDQVSLSLALSALQIEIDFLPEKFNFPTRAMKVETDTIFAHYHDPITIWNNDKLRDLYFELESSSNVFRSLIENSWQWRWVFKSQLQRFIASNRYLNRQLARLKNRSK
jgi:lipopolysaccharide biosynthesis glycosyltransferase